MSFLNFLSQAGGGSPELAILSTVLNVFGAAKSGRDAEKAADYQAAQLRQNAGQVQASSQRDAYEVDRQTQMVLSRALAVAAASGGGASDPTVLNIMAQDAAEGAYRKAVALYQGNDRARVMNDQANAKVFEGDEAKAGGNMRAVTNLMGGYAKTSSLYSRFGGGGPAQPGSINFMGPT